MEAPASVPDYTYSAKRWALCPDACVGVVDSADGKMCEVLDKISHRRKAVVPRSSDGDVSKVGYFFDIPTSLRLSLYTIMT